MTKEGKDLIDEMSSRSHRKINFNVSDQYEIIDVIGEGAYGVVAYILHMTRGLTIVLLCIGRVDRKSL